MRNDRHVTFTGRADDDKPYLIGQGNAESDRDEGQPEMEGNQAVVVQ